MSHLDHKACVLCRLRALVAAGSSSAAQLFRHYMAMQTDLLESALYFRGLSKPSFEKRPKLKDYPVKNLKVTLNGRDISLPNFLGDLERYASTGDDMVEASNDHMVEAFLYGMQGAK